MKIINTIGWETPWLRAVVAYCCKELEYPARRLESATFTQAHGCTYRGRAYLNHRTIKVKIHPLNVYPVTSGRVRDLPEISLADAIEVLVLVTAHEIAHIERWERHVRGMRARGRRDTQCDRDTESLARSVLASFRADRESLLDRWGDPGKGPHRPAVFHRLTCRACGTSWSFARPISGMKQQICMSCHGDWKQGMPAREFLVYERVPVS